MYRGEDTKEWHSHSGEKQSPVNGRHRQYGDDGGCGDGGCDDNGDYGAHEQERLREVSCAKGKK
jgi:hypothetical protein